MTTLTDEQREWRKDALEAMDKLYHAIKAINGPYEEMAVAFAAHQRLHDFLIDDEDLGPCEACGEHIWMLAGDDYVSGDDGRFCMACVEKWNSEAREAEADEARS